MLELLVFVVKLAGLSTLAILAWLAWSSRRRGDPGREAPESGDPRPRDPTGAGVLRAFSGMLIVGAAAMLLITVVGVAADL